MVLRKTSWANKWAALLTLEELKAFLGVIIAMSIFASSERLLEG